MNSMKSKSDACSDYDAVSPYKSTGFNMGYNLRS